jgi:hypothetical protein
MAAFEKCIRALLKIDPFGAHPVGHPVMLIEADACGKGQIGTGSYEHPTPALVVDVEVVLHDPALGQLQMPAVFRADRDHDPGRFPGFENHHYLIGLGLLKVWVDKVITSTRWCIQNGRLPFLATVLDPVLKLLGDIAQTISRHSLPLAIGIKETDDPLGLLEGLNQSVQKNAVKTAVTELYAILVMFAEGVHRLLLCCQTPGTYRGECLCDIELEGYQGRSPCLVSKGNKLTVCFFGRRLSGLVRPLWRAMARGRTLEDSARHWSTFWQESSDHCVAPTAGLRMK